MSKRLFIAIKINPTEELLRRVCFLKNNLSEENINWIRDDHYHLTLQFLGKTPTKHISSIRKQLNEVIEKSVRFDLQITNVSMFGSKYNPKVLWFGIEKQSEIIKLHADIVEVMKKFGFSTDRQNFVPHLSIARIRKLKNKDHFKKVYERVEQGSFQKQNIQEVVLYESVMSPKGAEYHIVEKFQLS